MHGSIIHAFINVNYSYDCVKTVATFCFVGLWKSLNYFTLYLFIELLQMNNKVAKFDKFIKDNDAKRRRAIQKYQIEVLLKEQKQTEYEQLCEQLAALKKRSTSQIRVELNVWNVSETVFMTRGREIEIRERYQRERETGERERERAIAMGMFYIIIADKILTCNYWSWMMQTGSSHYDEIFCNSEQSFYVCCLF